MRVVDFFVGISLVGSLCNATLRIKLSYVLWLISNVFLCAHNIYIGEHSQAFMFAVNLMISIVGIKNTHSDPFWFRPNKKFPAKRQSAQKQ
ncbi:MAG: hypothetical protein LBT64_02220 [Puniceicoccales bacterium]|jgi:hypothetical protein|nr:hypothetical protein [Puniceicoccales bacterium]